MKQFEFSRIRRGPLQHKAFAAALATYPHGYPNLDHEGGLK